MRLKNDWVVIMIGLFASILASALLLDVRSMFYIDWNNHLWLIEYFGESIRHLSLPVMVSTNQLVGISNTLFYGQKFYALLGCFSAFVGSAVTVRIMVFMVFLLQFFQVYRAAMKTGSTHKISICIAVVMTWAIYPLTNLYSRGAITEFFAVAFLTCSLASFLCVIINEAKKPASRYDIVATGLFFVIAAVTHPLTALFGGLFLGILGTIALFFCEKTRRIWLLTYFVITAILALLILSPWIYVLSQFNNKLPVSASAAKQFYGSGFFPDSVDNILSRVSPLPLDLRSTQKGIHDVLTPYLDAQIALPLILLIAVFIYIGWKEKSTRFGFSLYELAIIWGSVFLLILSFTVSVCPQVSGWLGGFFDILQFPFRLTSYVNLFALVILVMLAGRLGQANVNSKQVINVCLAFCIGISFSALMLKLVHASAIQQESTAVDNGSWAPLPFGARNHLNDLPWSFYGSGDYSVDAGFAKDTVSGIMPVVFRNFNVLDGARFGHIEGLTVDLTAPALVVTNVQPFPWNQIVINGSPRPQSGIIIVGGREAVPLPQGSYSLEFVTRTDGIWEFLNFLSWVLLLGWIVVCSVIAIPSRTKITPLMREILFRCWTFVKKHAPYFLMAGVLLFAYYPVWTGYYLHTDDYFWSKWGNFASNEILFFTTIVGRPLTGLLYLCSVCVGKLAWMNLFRFLSVCNLCVAAFLLFRWLCSYRFNRWFSAFLSAAVFTLPPFQVYASYLSTAPSGIAVTLGILALFLVRKGLDSAIRTGMWLYTAAILFLVMAFALYQPSTCFYLTLLVVPFLTEKDLGSFVFWRKIFVFLAVFAAAVLLYYLPWRWWLQWASIPSFSTQYDGRLLVPDLGQRLAWFMKVPFLEASNFWDIHPLPAVSYGFMGLLGIGLVCMLRVQNWGLNLLRYCILLAFIPVSFFVVLVSADPACGYRLYSALSATLLLVGILPLVFSAKTGYRLFLICITFMLMVVGACWAHATVRDCFAVPDSKEIRYIIQAIKDAQGHGQADFSGVAIVELNGGLALGGRNEIGMPSTAHGENIRPIVMTALNELGIEKDIRVFDCYSSTVNLYWREYERTLHGMSLFSHMVPPQDNTIVVDMNKIRDIH